MGEELAAEVAAIRRQLDDMAQNQAAFQKDLMALLAKPGGGMAIGHIPPSQMTVLQVPSAAPPAAPGAAPPVAEKAVAVGETAVLPEISPSPSCDDEPKRLSSTATRVSSGPTDEEVKGLLKETLEMAEAEEERQIKLRQERKDRITYMMKTLRGMTASDLELFVDSVMGFVIFTNAIFIGFSMDMSTKSPGWLAADIFFSASFLFELCLKIYMNGFRSHFLEHKGNILDAGLVLVDLLQLIMLLAGLGEDSGLPSASLFRLLRLLKLGRVLSVLRTEMFSDLLSMIQGMMGGLTTLVWSMVLFFLTVYMVALLFREFFGRREAAETVYPFFSSTPRSIFTTFRCSFGDCSTGGGTPIFEHIQTEFGTLSSMFCCVFVFVVTIGLFNVISAIFVESTMVAAMSLETKKRRQRLADRQLWSTRISTLVRCLISASPDHEVPEKMSTQIDYLYDIDLPGAIINKFVQDPNAIEALDDLEIDPEDHAHLSDILDPDNSGSIGLKEFVEGLGRLRGVPRRSDIVTVDLMVRSVQKHLHGIEEKVEMLLESRMMSAVC